MRFFKYLLASETASNRSRYPNRAKYIICDTPWSSYYSLFKFLKKKNQNSHPRSWIFRTFHRLCRTYYWLLAPCLSIVCYSATTHTQKMDKLPTIVQLIRMYLNKFTSKTNDGTFRTAIVLGIVAEEYLMHSMEKRPNNGTMWKKRRQSNEMIKL